MKKVLQARVGSGFLSKAHRLFDSSPATIFGELIQNSRRAGATEIQVEIRQEGNNCVVDYNDNGSGIDDLSKLLELSESGWEDEIKSDEEPAGMGMFSLANLPGKVDIYSKGQTVSLDPEVFSGIKSVEVLTCDCEDPGTNIMFEIPGDFSVWRIEEYFASAVRYANIQKVVCNGVERDSSELVSVNESIVTDEDLGVRIGVRREPYRASRGDLSFNFHGILVIKNAGASVLSVLQKESGLLVEAELLHCRRLKMVHPARNAMTENEALREYYKLACKAIFMRLAEDKHELPFHLWDMARKEFGVKLSEPDWRRVSDCVYNGSHEPYDRSEDQQIIREWEAKPLLILEHGESSVPVSHFLEFLPQDTVYLRSRREYAGYPSYDAIRRARLKLLVNDQEVEDDSDQTSGVFKVDSIFLVAEDICESADNISTSELEFAVLSGNSKYAYFDEGDFRFFVQRDFNDAKTMSDWVCSNMFEASNDYDSDSEAEQRDFEKQAFLWCLSICDSPKSALEHAIEESLQNIFWHAFNNATVEQSLTIKIRKSENGGSAVFKFEYDQ